MRFKTFVSRQKVVTGVLVVAALVAGFAAGKGTRRPPQVVRVPVQTPPILIEKTPIIIYFSNEVEMNGFRVGDEVYANREAVDGVFTGKGTLARRAKKYFKPARITGMGYHVPSRSLMYTVEWKTPDGEKHHTASAVAIPKQRVLVLRW